MRLCLGCKTLNRTDAHYCEGCSRSLGCKVCRRCGHTNSMTGQFCAACAAPRLTTPVFYLPLSWLTRLLILGLGWALLVWLVPRLEPLWESTWTQILCWAKIAFAAWIVLTLGWLLALSLLPEKSAKVFRTFTKQTILLIAALLKLGLRFVFWLFNATGAIRR